MCMFECTLRTALRVTRQVLYKWHSIFRHAVSATLRKQYLATYRTLTHTVKVEHYLYTHIHATCHSQHGCNQ